MMPPRLSLPAFAFSLTVLSVLVVVSAAPANAGTGIWDGRYPVTCNRPTEFCTFCDALKVTANIIDFLTKLALTISGAMIAYGGIRFIFSSGSSSGVSAAKSALVAAAIGLLITLLSWVIVNSILTLLAGSDYSLTNPVQCVE